MIFFSRSSLICHVHVTPRLCGAGKFETAKKLMELVQHTESDAWLALSLATHLNLLPLTRQLSCLSGCLWSRTLQAWPPNGFPYLSLS
jgi:DNA polymerase alpha subunit A